MIEARDLELRQPKGRRRYKEYRRSNMLRLITYMGIISIVAFFIFIFVAGALL